MILRQAVATAAAVAVIAVLAGCGGDSGGGLPANTGTVVGQVKDIEDPSLSFTGVVVEVGPVTTQTQDSVFEARGVPLGTHDVIVHPPQGYYLPPGTEVQATITKPRQVVDVGTIYIVAGSPPPNPP